VSAERAKDFSPGTATRVAAGLTLLFLLAPVVIAAIVAFSSGSRLEFPIPGLSLKWFQVALTKAQYIGGLQASVILGVASAFIATVAGTSAAIGLHRYRFRGRALIQTMVMLPIATPAIVLGLGILFTLPLYRMNPGLLAATFGHAVIGVPYVIAMVNASLADHDPSLERASMNLGAGPFRTFAKVTLPLIRNGVLTGFISAFLLSFDNFSLSLFITRGDTLPLRLMQQLLANADPSIAAMSTLLVLGSLSAALLLFPLLKPRSNV
jgi:putative spermidine/putrescine transport system permease protein